MARALVALTTRIGLTRPLLSLAMVLGMTMMVLVLYASFAFPETMQASDYLTAF